MKIQEEQTNPTAVDFLNSEWAGLLVQANNKIAVLSEENAKLKEVVDKQEEMIEALEQGE